LFALGVVGASLGEGPLLESLLGLGGNCAVLMGLRGRLLMTYVGLPLWSAVMAVGDLRSLDAQATGADAVLVGMSLILCGLMALLAISLRRRLFPYSTWRGVPRTAGGAVVIPDELLLMGQSSGGGTPSITPTVREEGRMSDQIAVQLSRDARNTLIGKAACLLVFGVIAGYYLHLSILADNARAAALTLQAYTAEYEQYKAGLMQDELPLWGSIALTLVMLGGFFTLYEALGWACGRVTGRLLASHANEDSPRGDRPA
jgi:hypothetical protein